MRNHWSLAHDVIYLNHGSFGPSPQAVQQARQEWTDRLEREPMDFFIRQMENHLDEAAARLGDFVGADANDLIFVDNATTAMNIVAENSGLQPDDEVLLSSHEYGAVVRIWRRTCQRTGARLVVQHLPSRIQSQEELAAAFLEGATDRTRLIVISHVTSPTALILPVEEICRQARLRGIRVCIDGPHALAMVPLNIRRLNCDYYAASCHKWLCGPFGTGFLYVRRRYQQGLQPVVMSWGGSPTNRPSSWKDEFTWIGTRDPGGFLTIPAAIDFFEAYGWDRFRSETHALAQYAWRQIVPLTGLEPPIPDSPTWYGSMIALPLPALSTERREQKTGHRDPLQDILWDRFRIEVPITNCQGRRYIRISCHLYNDREQIDQLAEALDRCKLSPKPSDFSQ